MVAIWFIDYMRFSVALLCAAVRVKSFLQ